MTNEEIIAKFREEIARLQPNAPKPGNMKSVDAKVAMQVHARLNKLLSFVSDLEKSLPAKVSDSKGLETEAVSYCFDNGLNISPRVATDFARHFYDLGCCRTAEKYDELEYNRQRASIPNDLEEAAEKFARIYDQGTCDGIAQDCFIAGAKWQKQHDAELIEIAYNDGITIGITKQKEQMMKEAVEWMVTTNLANRPVIYLDQLRGYKYGDKVRVIIVKEEENGTE